METSLVPDNVRLRALALREQIGALKDAIAKGATDVQLDFFSMVCARLDLDPFKEEIYWSTQMKKPIVGRRGHLKYATKDPNFIGVYSYVIRSTDEMTFEYTEDGPKWRFVPNIKNRGQIVGAFAVGHNRRWKYPLIRFAYLSEFDRGGSGAWATHKETMMRKIPESQVLETMFYEMSYADPENDLGERMSEDQAGIEIILPDGVDPGSIAHSAVDEVEEESTTLLEDDDVEYVVKEDLPTPQMAELKEDYTFLVIDGATYVALDKVLSMETIYADRDSKSKEKLFGDLVTAVATRGLAPRIKDLISQVAANRGCDVPSTQFVEYCKERANKSEDVGEGYIRMAVALGISCGDPELLTKDPYSSAWRNKALPVLVEFVTEEG